MWALSTEYDIYVFFAFDLYCLLFVFDGFTWAFGTKSDISIVFVLDLYCLLFMFVVIVGGSYIEVYLMN